jgi:hypothetical protein
VRRCTQEIALKVLGSEHEPQAAEVAVRELVKAGHTAEEYLPLKTAAPEHIVMQLRNGWHHLPQVA